MTVCFDSAMVIVLKNGRLVLKPLVVSVAAVFFLLNMEFVHYAGNWVYLGTEEANPLITYVRDYIADGEYLYVYAPAEFIVEYKNGYNTSKIGDVEQDNIIWGGDFSEWWDPSQDSLTRHIRTHDDGRDRGGGEFNKILAAKKAYLLFYHFSVDSKAVNNVEENGLKTLATLGYLHKVGEFYKTPLYYFTTDPDDPKRSETYDFGE
jgi:hypothetical protein